MTGFKVKPGFPFLLFPSQSKCKGQDLFDQIMYHIDLVETDYFGLQFMDTEQVSVSNKQHTLAFMLTNLQLILIIIIIITFFLF